MPPAAMKRALLLFLAAFGYAFATPELGRLPQAFSALAFVTVLAVAFAGLMREALEGGPWQAVGFAAALHLGIVLGAQLSGRGPAVLWIKDSYDLHIPGAMNFANWISGKAALRPMLNAFDKIFLTHVWVGLFFLLFGVNVFASGFALMLPKLLTVYCLYRLARSIFDARTASLAALIYVFMPTILFYTTVFNKEAVIQLITLAAGASIYSIFESGPSPLNVLALFSSLGLILNERFYLFAAFAATLALFLILAREKLGRGVLIAAGSIVAPLSFLFIRRYLPWYNHMFKGGPLLVLPNLLNYFRHAYGTYPDVTPINYALPYPLSFVKICLTPFLTLDKFRLFDKFSYILIWGTLISQLVIALSFAGMYRALKDDWRAHWFTILPYLLFLGVFAYVAPFDGRARDSFYPIISMYAAHFLSLAAQRSRSGRAARAARPPRISMPQEALTR